MSDAALAPTAAPERLQDLSVELRADGVGAIDGAGRHVVFITRDQLTGAPYR